MYNYLVDVSRCETEEELHRVLRDSLGFPKFYGMNLDALWDCLTGFMAIPATITLCGAGRAKKDVKEELGKVIDTIQDAIREYNEIILFIED